ncbi:hypothetical protein [Hyphomicrobium sp. MC1]|uniref:hypothetical protein n=1 Tax=Hyphomicrobium sp. (strain MC1) TaxID=717785 RepID=UPI000213EAC3|nr:hypothetical protein [Hyphomicrobium sp. MC1]CCB64058.1 protein of unknown function [Hyphomicrobium sp. MC1]
MTEWDAAEQLRRLRSLTGPIFADVADIERLYVKINATVKGHVESLQFDELMADQPAIFYAERMNLSEIILQASQGIARSPWALDDECKALFGLTVTEFASRLRQLSEISTQATEDFRRQNIRKCKPRDAGIDRLIMDLARIYFEGCKATPILRRKNGQAIVSESFCDLLRATYDVLPNALHFRSYDKEAFIQRAKRMASKIEQRVEAYRPIFYRDSAVR